MILWFVTGEDAAGRFVYTSQGMNSHKNTPIVFLVDILFYLDTCNNIKKKKTCLSVVNSMDSAGK